MNRRYTIHVPERFNERDGGEVAYECLSHARTKMAAHFGGYTETRGSGAWLDSSGGLVQDGLFLIAGDAPPEAVWDMDAEFMRALAFDVQELAKQDAVYWTVHTIYAEVIS